MDMTRGSLWRNLFLYTVPIILTGLLQLTFNAVDLIVVGRFCGSISVAAVGATNAISQFIVNFFIGVAVGAGVGVAQGTGAKDDEQVSRIVHTSIPTAIVGGVLLTFLGVVFARPLLEFMATPEDVIGLSTAYMRLFFSGMTFMMVFNFGASILRAVGDTTSPLLILTISGLCNVGMNLVFVLACGMDVDGVGLATALSQIVAAVLVVIRLMRRTDACRLELRRMGFDGRSFRKIIGIGIPAGIQGTVFSISNVVVQSSVNSLGSVAMTGNAAAHSIEGFEFVCMNSFMQTSMNFTGQNVGARQFDRVRKLTGICVLYVALAGLIMSSLIFIFRRFLLGIYITDSPEAIEMGIIRFYYICVPYMLCGMMDTVTGSLRGLGYSMFPMLASIVGIVLLRVVWILAVFPHYHTLHSIYISYPLSWIVTLAADLVMFFYAFRRVRSQVGG